MIDFHLRLHPIVRNDLDVFHFFVLKLLVFILKIRLSDCLENPLDLFFGRDGPEINTETK